MRRCGLMTLRTLRASPAVLGIAARQCRLCCLWLRCCTGDLKAQARALQLRRDGLHWQGCNNVCIVACAMAPCKLYESSP